MATKTTGSGLSPPKGVSLGVWRDSVRNAIEWVPRNVRDGARGKR
jgi:hypothetical protein